MENYFYKVIIEPCAEGGFTALIPKLPDVFPKGILMRSVWRI